MKRFFSFIRIVALSAVGLGVFSTEMTASAQGRLGLIRDTEIEIPSAAYRATFEAGLDPGSVMFIVNDRNPNAFVAGGQKYLFTVAC